MIRTTVALGSFCLVVALGACDKETAPAAKNQTVEAKPLDALFVGKQPTIPAVFKSVSPGMAREDVEKVLGPAELDGFESREYDGARSYQVTFDGDGKVAGLIVRLNTKSGLAALKKAWGTPVEGAFALLGKTKLHFWWNPAKRLRAIAREESDGLEVTFETYFPLTDFLGAAGPKFGFEATHPVLGGNVKALIEAYGSKMVVDSSLESATLTLPPTDFETSPTRIRTKQDREGNITLMSFGLSFGHVPSNKQHLLDMLANKFGGLKKQPEWALDHFVTATNPRVRVSQDTYDPRFDVFVSPRATDAEPPAAKKPADAKAPVAKAPESDKPGATAELKKPAAPPPGLTSCTKMFHTRAIQKKAQSAATFEEIPKRVDPKANRSGKDLCGDTKLPCGPKAEVSVISYDDISSEAIVIKRAGADGYWYIGRPWDTYMVAVEHRVQKLGAFVHVGVTVPLYERVPFCDDEDDPDSCTSATALVGEENTDYVVDPKTGAIAWEATCALDEGEDSQNVKIALEGDTFSYTGCQKGTKPVRFTLAHLATCPSPEANYARKAKRLINMGRKATKAGRHDEAIKHYDAALKIDADSLSALAERGYAHLKAGRLDEARTDFDNAIEAADPKKKKKFLGAVFFNLGLVEEKAKNTKAAKAAYTRSLEFRPSKFVQKKLDALK